MSEPFVIVGGGLAAGTAAAAVREQGYAGDLVLLTEEPLLPYERPGLSKAYLVGSADADSLFVHPSEWYAEHGVEVRTGCHVDELDPEAHTVTAGGRTQGYA